MSLVNALLDLVFAPVCLGCDALISTGDSARLMCKRCHTRLRAPPSPGCFRCGAPLLQTGRVHERFDCPECSAWPDVLRFARAACLMEPPADRFVHQLKYRGWHALAVPMAVPMARLRWPDEAHEPAVVTAVPTTAKRLRERGYNQAEALARAFANATGRRYVSGLQRTFATKTQTALQPAARAANVAGAFAASDPLAGAHVILVDDVLTTGATAGECARALAAAGACCIRLITFARAFEIRGLTRPLE
jgi:predicted amidophosphoribosyltransferase